MNETLLDIFLSNEQNYDLWRDERIPFRYIYLGDSESIFEDLFYPFIEQLNENQRLELVEKLSQEQKEVLLRIPEELLKLMTIDIIDINDENENIHVLEVNCFVRIVKSYKHQVFFELLSYINVNKTHSIDKENHGFGYHFHLYEKSQRTKTLLTFDKDELQNKKGSQDYNIFNHTLYYEPHSEGSAIKEFLDINYKNGTFKSNIYKICKSIIIDKIDKINFKKQSSTKSKKCVL